MTGYYLEVRYRVTPVDAVDAHTDAMMDALSVEPGLTDADVGADLRRGWTDVCAVVEGEDEASALRTGLAAIRSAAHHAGAATPGWEADLDRVMATVRPSDLMDAYPPAEPMVYPRGSVTHRTALVPPAVAPYDDPIPRTRQP